MQCECKGEVTAEWQCEQLLNSQTLRRPTYLAQVKIRLLRTDYALVADIARQFQQLLDSECARPNFFDDAGAVPGFIVLEHPWTDMFEVRLFSTKRGVVKEKWVDVSSAQGVPGYPGY
jgi:hypothetical protein